MKAEEHAWRLYTAAAEMTGDPRLKNILLTFAEVEKGHKKRLEEIYEEKGADGELTTANSALRADGSCSCVTCRKKTELKRAAGRPPFSVPTGWTAGFTAAPGDRGPDG
jgi:hypothetical protein